MKSRLASALTCALLLVPGIALAESHSPRNDHRAILFVADNDTGHSAAKRDAYMQKAKTEFRSWQDRMHEWADAAKEKSADISEDTRKRLDQAWADVKDNWNMLQAAAPAGWDKARTAYEQASQRLKSAWQNVRPQG